MKKALITALTVMGVLVSFSAFGIPCYHDGKPPREEGRIATPLSLGFTPSLQYPAFKFMGDDRFFVYGLRAGVWMNADSCRDFMSRCKRLDLTEVYGLSVGLLTMNDRKVKGGQFSVLYSTASEVYGVQLGTLNGANKVYGVQTGLVNFHDCTGPYYDMNVSGVQIGLVNSAQFVRGVQVGLFNNTRYLKGVQVGLLNFNCDGFIPVLRIGLSR